MSNRVTLDIKIGNSAGSGLTVQLRNHVGTAYNLPELSGTPGRYVSDAIPDGFYEVWTNESGTLEASGQHVIPGKITESAMAARSVGTNQIGEQVVKTEHIANGVIITAHLQAGIDPLKLGQGNVSADELSQLNGITDNVQNQLDAKAEKVNLTAHTEATSNAHPLSALAATGSANAQVALDAKLPAATYNAHLTATNAHHATNISQGSISNASNVDEALSMLRDGTGIAGGAIAENQLRDESVTDDKVAFGIDARKVGGGYVSNAEYAYLNGVTGSIQSQINGIRNILLYTPRYAEIRLTTLPLDEELYVKSAIVDGVSKILYSISDNEIRIYEAYFKHTLGISGLDNSISSAPLLQCVQDSESEQVMINDHIAIYLQLEDYKGIYRRHLNSIAVRELTPETTYAISICYKLYDASDPGVTPT